MKHLYMAFDVEELSRLLEDVVLNQKDPLVDERIAIMEEVGLSGFHASHNVINELNKLLS